MCFRIAFDIVNKESLSKIIAKHRDEEVEDADLMDRGYFNSMWKNYKHSKVSEALKENGKMKYMCKDGPSHVAERPPSALYVFLSLFLNFFLNSVIP